MGTERVHLVTPRPGSGVSPRVCQESKPVTDRPTLPIAGYSSDGTPIAGYSANLQCSNHLIAWYEIGINEVQRKSSQDA